MSTTKVIKMSHLESMDSAVREACVGVAAGDGGPFGAAIVKDGQIVAVGHNMVLANKDPTCHAEMTAIRNACKALGDMSLAGCVIYTSCYPCPMCMGACLWARLDAIYYAATSKEAADAGFDDAEFHNFLKDPKSDDLRLLEHVPVTGTTTPFEMWNKKIDRIPY